LQANDDVTLGLRPEHVNSVFNGGDIALDLSLDEVESLGDSTNIYAKLFDQLNFRVRLQGQQDFTGTDRLTLYIAPKDILVFDSCGDAIVADTGKTAKPH
jgi:multiple sugar transport system ATP-binding protein/lactose/L-arabinose transport system ATP-binding protein